MSAETREAFDSFLAAVRKRWGRGETVFGDRSYDRPPDELADEVMQELEDVAAWAAILWKRMRDIQEAVPATEQDEQ